jgi:hypothetical protein
MDEEEADEMPEVDELEKDELSDDAGSVEKTGEQCRSSGTPEVTGSGEEVSNSR